MSRSKKLYIWKTDEVVKELAKIESVKSVKATGAGGDYDTTQVVITVCGSKDRLYVSGFYSTEEPIKDRDNSPVPWVELTDGLDSRGGLNSKNKTLARVFIEVRQYFIDKNVDVIDHYNQIF